MSSLAAQKDTLPKLLEYLNTWQLDALRDLFASNFIRKVQPSKSLGQIEDTAEILIGRLQGMPALAQQPGYTSNFVHDEEAHKSSFEFVNKGDTNTGPFDLECMMIVQFTEDGKKIVRVDEYLDTKAFGAFLEKAAAAMGSEKPGT